MVREIGLAAEKTESPAWETSIVHEPIARMLTMPMLEIEHTEPPEITVDVTPKALEADASRTKSGLPSS